MNLAILTGRLGKDPELKQFDNGTTAARISLATSRKFKDKSGEKQEKTEWHTLKLWGKQAELAGQYLSKGDRITVQGEINYRSYGEGEAKKYFTEINVHKMDWLDVKGKDKPEPATTSEPTGDDDLPF